MARALSSPYRGAETVNPLVTIASRLDVVMEGTWLLVVGVIPLLFNRAGENYFGLYKSAFLFLAVTFLAALWLARKALVPNMISAGQGADTGRLHLPRSPFPLALPIALFALSQIVSTSFSVAPATSFWGSFDHTVGTISVLALIGFAVLMGLNLQRKEQVHRVLWTVTASSTLVAFLGVLEWMRWVPSSVFLPYEGRIASTIGQPVLLGQYLVMTMPLTSALFLMHGQAQARRWVWHHPLALSALTFSLFVQGFALALTAARGPWLGLIVAGGVLVLCLGVYGKRRWLLKVSILCGAAVLIFLLGIMMLGSPLHGLRDLPLLSRAASAVEFGSGSVKSRLVTWEATVRLLRERPALGSASGQTSPLRHLVGYGPETFPFAFDTVSPGELSVLEGPQVRMGRAHNFVLDLLVMTGLLGLASFLLLIGAAYRHALRGVRNIKEPQYLLIRISLIAALSGYLMAKVSGVDDIDEQVMFWTILALLIGTLRLGLREQPFSASSLAAPPAARITAKRGMLLAAAVALGTLGALLAGTTVLADMHSRKGLEALGGRDWPQAVAAFDRAVTVAPYRPRYHEHLFRTGFLAAQETSSPEGRRKLIDFARNHVQRAQALEPVNHHYILLQAQLESFAALTLDAARGQKATELYRQAAALSPNNVHVLNAWAYYELSSLRPQNALALLQQSLALNPTYSETHRLIGQVQGQLRLSSGGSNDGPISQSIECCVLG